MSALRVEWNLAHSRKKPLTRAERRNATRAWRRAQRKLAKRRAKR